MQSLNGRRVVFDPGLVAESTCFLWLEWYFSAHKCLELTTLQNAVKAIPLGRFLWCFPGFLSETVAIPTTDRANCADYNLLTGRRFSKAFYRSLEVRRQRFWLTFTFLLETISALIIKIPLIGTNISLLWDLN